VLRKLSDRLILIGVAHVLPKSSAEVQTTIERERPEIVAVELCPTRYAALTRKVREASPLEALRARQLSLFVLNKLLYLLQARFARQTGMPAGKEMLTALRCAERVGARVELIDRDIGITLQRLIQRMGKREKLRLLVELLFGFLPFGPRIELERVTEDQIVAQLLRSLRRASPTAYEVLIEERNVHMAAEVTRLLATTKGKLVCVVGAGHIPGLSQRLAAPWGTLELSWKYA
jgi:pheromone shutdown-related protein TraB